MKQFSVPCLLACLMAPLAGCGKSPQVAAISHDAQVPRESAVAWVPAYHGPLLDLRGSGTRIGTEYGQQLHEPIATLHERYLNVYLGSGLKRFLALAAASRFESYFQPEHKEEIQALARASDMDEREAVLAQCFLDLSPMTACSTITLPASAAPDHVARFGRNLDFPSLNVADKYSAVLVFHPEGKYAFASIGWPGMIGVLSGMNEHGLALANMEVTRSPRLPGAMPYTLLYRTVLEQCRTVSEAIDLIEHTPRQTANNLMLMDAASDRAVIEITPDTVDVRRAPDAEPLVSTNHQRGTDCDTTGRCRRYDYLRETAEQELGHIDRDQIKSMLAHVCAGPATLQSMIFEPANRVIYLSTGARAAMGTFEKLDLKPLFK